MNATIEEPDAPLAVRPTTPMEILAVMVEKGCDVETLERMQAMAERYEDRLAEKAYNAAMNACQAEMPSVVWDGQNTQTNSRFAYIETIQKYCQPIWIKHGFSLSFSEANCPLADMKRNKCRVRHSAGHSEDHFIDLYNDGVGAKGNPIGNMNRVQGQVSTMSYGQRKLLCLIFNIRVAGEDNDAQGAKIDGEHVRQINDLLIDTKTDLKKFCAWAKVESLDEMPVTFFDEAVRMLKAKASKNGGGK